MKRGVKTKRTGSKIRFVETNEKSEYASGKILFPEELEIANKILSNCIFFETLEEYKQYKKEQANTPS